MTVPEPTKRRGPIYAEYRGPGPLSVNLPTTIGTKGHSVSKTQGPAYSIGKVLPARKNKNPGPEYIYDSALTNKGKHEAPTYSLYGRHKCKGVEITPGPGAYNLHDIRGGALSHERRMPSISMGQRSDWAFKNEAPPPNAYNLQNLPVRGAGATAGRAAPAWSLTGRTDVGSARYIGVKSAYPASNVYNPCEPNLIRPRQGAYTMQGRTQPKDYSTIKHNPGPGAYDPMLRKKGGFSMGVRHSEYMLPVIADVDLM